MTARRLVLVGSLALAPRAAGAQDAQGVNDASPARPTAPYETVVTAPPAAAALRAPLQDRAASASVVLPDESPRARDDLGSLMLEVPGVTTTRSGSAMSFTTLSLRGSNPDQVRVFVDGVPLAIAEGGAVDISTLPLGDVERVEVYRGQTPLAFGESAMGGVLSITTRTPGDSGLRARAGVASFGTRFADLQGGGHLGRLRLYLGVHGLSSVGDYPYENDNGTKLDPSDDTWTTRQNDDVSQADGTLRAAVDLAGRRTLSLGVVGFAREQGLPGTGFAQTRFARFETGRGLSVLRLDDRDSLGAGGRLSAALFASGQRDHYSDPGELSAGPWSTHDDTLTAGANANASRPLADWLRLAAVAEARVETFHPRNDTDPRPDGAPARRLLAVGGLEPTFFVRRLDLEVIPSARVEVERDVVTGRDPLLRTQQPASAPLDRALPVWRLALMRPLGSVLTLKANVGRYERSPSFLELYAATGRLIGNRDLRPERGTNADLALALDAAPGSHLRLSSRTALFGARVDDLIEWERNAYGPSTAENVAGARLLGAEEELRVALSAWGRLVAQVTYLDAVDRSGDPAHEGRQLPFRPRWQIYARPELARLRVARGAAGGVLGAVVFGAYVDGALVAGVFDTPSNLTPLPTRVLVGAGVSAEVPRWGLRAVLSGQDLTRSWTYDMAYYPVPGRTITLALAFQAAPRDSNRNDTIN